MRAQQPALRQIAHQIARRRGPFGRLVVVVHHVHQRTELVGRDRHHVARMMRKALPGASRSLPARTWCREQHRRRRDTGDPARSSGHKVFRIAADLADIA